MEQRAAQIRAGLKHPVIDGDGHWMEPIPVFLEYLAEVGGSKAVDQMRANWRRNATTTSWRSPGPRWREDCRYWPSAVARRC